jgi:hypothetical protein
MFPPKAAYVETSILVEQAIHAIEDYDYERGDCLLLLGDASIIAAVLLVLCRRVDEVCVLRFDRIIQRYSKVKFNLGEMN